LTVELSTLETELDDVSKQLVDARSRFELATQRFVMESERSELAAQLLAVVDGATSIGLVDGHCPVCDAERTRLEFEAGIRKARGRVADLSKSLAEARANQAQESNSVKVLESRNRVLTDRVGATKHDLTRIAASLAEFDREAARLAVQVNGAFSDDKAAQLLASARERMLELERLAISMSSTADSERVRVGESRVNSMRHLLAQSAARLSRAEKAGDTAKQIVHTIKRTAGEVLDQRLAAISPLLEEFYLRLRPHAAWDRIEYSIRGDVQRLLSLRVGNGLNPQFMFSSGQRRAAGLAFLLSVHMAGKYGNLNSLLIDDPVQHVDDYRAVNLVELLAAIAGTGRQILCTVEDSGLAELMGRRMTASAALDGKRFELEYHLADGSTLASTRDLFPPISRVLRESA
jgi:DNA repair exonuclease SbcCD ATPase subunit